MIWKGWIKCVLGAFCNVLTIGADKTMPFWVVCSSLTIICYNTIPHHLVSVAVYDV